MPPRLLYRLFSLVILLALSVSCTPGAAASQTQPAAASTVALPDPAATSALAATPAPAPKGTRGPKQPQGGGQKQPQGGGGQKQGSGSQGSKPQTFPTSSYAVSDANFNLILGRPTTSTITANLYAKTDMQVTLAYGSSSGNYSTKTDPINLKAGLPQTVELTNLQPDSAYFYQAVANGAPSSEHTFHTQRTPGSTFSFTIDADPHNRDPNFNGQLYAITLANAAAEKPDFHINLGDTFMTEKVQASTYAEAESTFTDMRPYLGIIGADAPLYLVNGNHEAELGSILTGGPVKELPVWATQLRQLYYPNPSPNGFYSGGTTADQVLGSVRDGYYGWTWGDAQFIVLDPFWYTAQKPAPGDLNNNWNWTLGKAQYDWLKTTLENSPSKYKFVFIHNLVGGNDKDARGGIEAAPYFEWGGKNADGSDGFDAHRPGW